MIADSRNSKLAICVSMHQADFPISIPPEVLHIVFAGVNLSVMPYAWVKLCQCSVTPPLPAPEVADVSESPTQPQQAKLVTCLAM